MVDLEFVEVWIDQRSAPRAGGIDFLEAGEVRNALTCDQRPVDA